MPGTRRTKLNPVTETNWTEVIAKALSYLAVNTEDLKGKTLTDRAAFLLSLGLSHRDAAGLLGSTEGSIKVLLRRAATKSGPRHGRKQK